MIKFRKPVIIFAVVFLLGISITAGSIISNAQDNDNSNDGQYKYFKSIEIAEGDTLWSIADEYASEQYGSVKDYINELKSMNDLKSDTIHAGEHIVIAYYSDELK